MTEAERNVRSWRLLAFCLVAAIILTALDLGTKAWALDRLSAESFSPPGEVCEPDENGFIRTQRRRRAPVVVVDGIFEFSYAENCGAAFGFLRDFPFRRYIFFPAALIAVLLLPWMVRRGHGGKWLVYGAPFIMAGALGNLYDRVTHGFVVDFIRFYTRDGLGPIPAGWEYPTFNVADIHITVGVVCILLDGFVVGRHEAEEEAEEGAEEGADEGADEGAGPADAEDEAAASTESGTAVEAPEKSIDGGEPAA